MGKVLKFSGNNIDRLEVERRNEDWVSEKINDQNHHPLISINYNKLHVQLFTFDSNSLTKKDTDLAVSIDKLYLDFSIL